MKGNYKVGQEEENRGPGAFVRIKLLMGLEQWCKPKPLTLIIVDDNIINVDVSYSIFISGCFFKYLKWALKYGYY